MGLLDRIITTFAKTHSALPDRPTGITTADLKDWYDSSANELKVQTNGIIADLTAATGASQLGAQVVDASDASSANIMAKLQWLFGQMIPKTNTTAFTPTTQYHPATKGYVDAVGANFILGVVSDGSIIEAKLATAVVTSIAEKTISKNGTGTFPLGGTTYVVNDAFITVDTWVQVSPVLTNKVGTWDVVSSAGFFTITSTDIETSNIAFDWRASK